MQGTGSYSFGILEITVEKFFYGKKNIKYFDKFYK